MGRFLVVVAAAVAGTAAAFHWRPCRCPLKALGFEQEASAVAEVPGHVYIGEAMVAQLNSIAGFMKVVKSMFRGCRGCDSLFAKQPKRRAHCCGEDLFQGCLRYPAIPHS